MSEAPERIWAFYTPDDFDDTATLLLSHRPRGAGCHAMTDCRTCKHNIYGPKIDDWVSCGHPETIAQKPRPKASDPAWVNFMTADMRVGDMLKMFASHGPCATHEATP